MKTKPNNETALDDWKPEQDEIVFEAEARTSTGIREDDEVSQATNLVHSWTSDGRGTILDLETIALAKLGDSPYTPTDLANAMYKAGDGIVQSCRYDATYNGNRIGQFLVLNANAGTHAPGCEVLAFVELPMTSTSRQKVGNIGVARFSTEATDRNGKARNIGFRQQKDNQGRPIYNADGTPVLSIYLDTAQLLPIHFQGWVTGYKYLETAQEAHKELADALATIRRAEWQKVENVEDDFRDTPPTPCDY